MTSTDRIHSPDIINLNFIFRVLQYRSYSIAARLFYAFDPMFPVGNGSAPKIILEIHSRFIRFIAFNKYFSKATRGNSAIFNLLSGADRQYWISFDESALNILLDLKN